MAGAGKWFRRVVEYLLAVGRHFYLLGAAVLFTVIPFVESVLPPSFTARHITPHVGWSHWTAFAFFCAATFFAWNSERTARDLAERASPEALKKDLENVKAQLVKSDRATRQQAALFWQLISNGDAEKVANAFRALGSHSVRIAYHSQSDCVQLAWRLVGIFEAADWHVHAPKLAEKPIRNGISISSTNVDLGLSVNAILNTVAAYSDGKVRLSDDKAPNQAEIFIQVGQKHWYSVLETIDRLSD